MPLLPSPGAAHTEFDPPPPGNALAWRRLLKFSQMDWEVAAYQLWSLCVDPRRVYRNVYFHKQTKNSWARDDPAVFISISICMILAGCAWSVVRSVTVLDALKLCLLMLFRDFFLISIVVATLLWLVSNWILLQRSSSPSSTDARVEWAYAFDVHINAFFPLYLELYVLQLFLSPLILRYDFVGGILLGNTLYLIASCQYVYIVYLGLNALPFLRRTKALLIPIPFIFAGYVASLLGFNVTYHVLMYYFSP